MRGTVANLALRGACFALGAILAGCGASPAPPVRESARGPENGELDADDVRTVVHAHRSSIARCYEQAARTAARAPHVRSDVDVAIAPSGEVIHVVVRGPELASLGSCLYAAVRAWRFPAARRESRVSIPFVFEGRR